MQDKKTLDFLRKLRDSGNWNDDYDYSNVKYIDGKTNVLIIDKTFNTEHLINPNNLIIGYKCSIVNLKNGVKSFDEAREYARKLNLKSLTEWRDYTKKNKIPHYIPLRPDSKFKNNGWVSWADFLGFETKMGRKSFDYLPFEEARNYVRSLNLKTGDEWQLYCKSNKIPKTIATSK